MKKWEYLVGARFFDYENGHPYIYLDGNKYTDEQEALDAAGQSGWELVGAASDVISEFHHVNKPPLTKTTILLYFKRPLAE